MEFARRWVHLILCGLIVTAIRCYFLVSSVEVGGWFSFLFLYDFSSCYFLVFTLLWGRGALFYDYVGYVKSSM
jgi:hypothetical protein